MPGCSVKVHNSLLNRKMKEVHAVGQIAETYWWRAHEAKPSAFESVMHKRDRVARCSTTAARGARG
jgi:hypothetical protein